MSMRKEPLERPPVEDERVEKSSKRPVFEVATAPQIDLFKTVENSSLLSQSPQSERLFRDPNPRDIFLGGRRLDDYLREANQTDALLVRGLLRALNYDAFVCAYASEGRAPYAPAAMLGLILWGLIKGVNSLRGLEALARTDLGCMWVSGGITPEFSVIGRFIRRHGEILTEDFFIDLTAKTLKVCGSDGSHLAGDGTVIQAAASRYRNLTLEDLTKKAEDKPHDQDLQQRKETAQERSDEVTRRAHVRKDRGRDPSKTVIPAKEPDAYVQKMKRDGTAASYKPSILANSDRFILGQSVHPSSETSVVEAMLDQAKKITQKPTERLLLDGGYFNATVIDLAIDKDIDLLVPSGKMPGKSVIQPFDKEQFQYGAEHDRYQCPAGQFLTVIEVVKASETMQAYKRYGGAPCARCPFFGQCTKAERGRTIKRYEHDGAKEILREVMAHPMARKAYMKRQAWVEPVFGELRDIQGLARFRRKGLERVQLEFGLHTMAHNLRRMLKILGRDKVQQATPGRTYFWAHESHSQAFHAAWHIAQGFFHQLVRIEHYQSPRLC
jgi:transposase